MGAQPERARPDFRLSDLACHAAYHGQTNCLQVLSRYGIELNGDVSADALKGGHLSCLRLAHQLGDRWAAWHARVALEGGKGHE